MNIEHRGGNRTGGEYEVGERAASSKAPFFPNSDCQLTHSKAGRLGRLSPLSP